METVEILLATYNGEKYVREQIDSILQQDYQDWIIRACDDASKDGTYAILEEYKERYPERFFIHRNEVGYGSAKLNFMNLIQNSTGQYVMCCDQDDVWLPHKISATLEEMKRVETQGHPTLVHTDLKVVDANLNVIGESFFSYSKLEKIPTYNRLLIQNSITGCTMMMNRTLADLLKRDLQTEAILMHDWVVALLAAAKGNIGFVDTPTMLYRQHGVNSVGAKRYGIGLFLSKLRNSDIRKSLQDTTVQAGEIARVYEKEISRENYLLTKEYSQLFSQNKCKRIAFYQKYKIYKKGFPRKICQILMG